MNRRKFIKMLAGSMGAASLGTLPLSKSLAGTGKKMLIVFQFGGNDGVNTLIPRYDPTTNIFQQVYNDRRTTLKLDSGENINQASYLLNGSMAPMVDIWNDSGLSFFAGTGLKDGRASRSHFSASKNLVSKDHLGWIARFVRDYGYKAHSLSGRGGFYSARQHDSELIVGKVNSDGAPFENALSGYAGVEEYEKFFADMFDGAQQDFGLGAYYANHPSFKARSWYETQRIALESVQFNNLPPELPGVFPNNIGQDINTAARLLLHRDVDIVTVSHGGYDTHSSQHITQPGLLSDLSTSLKSFYDAMGGEMSNTVVLVITEFGRAINEIANYGTDHGVGALYYAFGGDIESKVYGEWKLKPAKTDVNGQVIGDPDLLETYMIGGNYFTDSILDSYDVMHSVFLQHFGVSPFVGSNNLFG